MSRVLCCTFVLVFSSAIRAETLVQEGDYVPYLEVEDSLLMTGGGVGGLLLKGPQATILGGEVGFGDAVPELRGIAAGGQLDIKGGRISGISRREDGLSSCCGPINLHGYYFQLYDRGKPEQNSYYLQGWLLDWSFVDFHIVNETEIRTSLLPTNFILYPSDGLEGDTNDDFSIDIEDLNLIRNNFGSPGDGDVTGDGQIDIADLNLIRNRFGDGPFTLLSDWPGRAVELRYQAPVPEPSAFWLAAITLPGLLRFSRCRRRRRSCRQNLARRRLPRPCYESGLPPGT